MIFKIFLFLCSPNEDLGTSKDMWVRAFVSTFHTPKCSIWPKSDEKVLTKGLTHIFFDGPKSSFGCNKFYDYVSTLDSDHHAVSTHMSSDASSSSGGGGRSTSRTAMRTQRSPAIRRSTRNQRGGVTTSAPDPIDQYLHAMRTSVMNHETYQCGKQHLREIATPDWVGQFTNLAY